MQKPKREVKSEKSILKKKVKNNRAITLIALVITIIVLLILAGVSIATLTGENGILTRAEDAKTETRGRTSRRRSRIVEIRETDGKIL